MVVRGLAQYTSSRGRAARDTPAGGSLAHYYFTTTFFHHPDELRAEVAETGFVVEALLGVEGPGWALLNLEARWADPAQRTEILAAARAVESEPSLLGFHPHVLAVGRAIPGAE